MAKTRRAPDDDVRRRRPDDDDDDRPRKARRGAEEDEDDAGDDEPFRPRKKRESAAAPVKLILRICAAVAGAVALVVLLYWVYSPVGSDYSLLCYFPKETVRLTGYDVADGAYNGQIKDVHDMILNNYRQFADRRFGTTTGVTPQDVIKYMSGTAAGSEEDKDLKPQDRRGSITVIRFRNQVNQDQFVGSFNGPYFARAATSKDGKAYHQLYRKVLVPPDNHPEEEDDISFFFPNSRTLVYTTTHRECEECLTRQSGRVVLEGNIRELADHVDGTFFQASTGGLDPNGVSNTMAFNLGIVDQELRDQNTSAGLVGSASWWADNGNDFLYASGALYSDKRTAIDVATKLSANFYKAQADIYQNGSGTPAGLEDPFNPKQPAQKGAAGGFGGGGGTTANEASKDIIEALSEYVKTARVRRLGRLVVIEGTISHGNPEQGTFEKFWRAAGSKFQPRMGGFGGPGGMMPGGMMPGGGGPMPGGMVPGGVPVGPGR